MRPRTTLIILDGFGIGKDSPFNAVTNAKMPFYRSLLNKYPHSQLITHGESVGLPEGVMGNSEVGHMTMGAGRVVYQDLTRISKAISSGEFEKNSVLCQTLTAGAQKTGQVHLMGLLSDAGVHSHTAHLYALMELCVKLQIPKVSIHAFLDGRDTPPGSATSYLRELKSHALVSKKSTQFTLTSFSGRYYAMDRDHRWERIEKAYRALTGQQNAVTEDPIECLEKIYATGITDEFVEPLLFSPETAMKTGDSVVFFNYRSDRARELTRALTEPEFHDFQRGAGFEPSSFAGLTQYDPKLTHARVAFPPQDLNRIFGEWLETHKKSQFRIAETEKYAHVTFFFNGGREAPFAQEDRLLIPSPRDVATYDLKPEMSAYTVAEKAAEKIKSEKYDFVLMNFANADMLGHTGNYEATIKALEALDECLAKVVGMAQKSHSHVLLTADHGNAEEMRDSMGRIHTQHTLNPVPLIWIAPNSAIAPKSSRVPLNDGNLSDLMPTLCRLMELDVPPEVTGRCLLPC